MNTVKLTSEDFKKKIFDYTLSKEWEYKGENPAIIDFYADWCGPCKMVSPIMEELAREYSGKLDVYKVDTQLEQELSAVFRIMSIPSILFIPMEGQPMMQAGALSKSLYQKVIDEELLKTAKVEN
jgi:thioredoxin 1